MDARPSDTLKDRRIRLGIPRTEFARYAGMDRSVVERVENGHARATSVAKYVEALERRERDHRPIMSQSGGQITFEVSGNVGVRVTASGPVEDADLVREQVSALVESMQPRLP